MKSKKYLEFREKYLDTYNTAYNEKLISQWQGEWDKKIQTIKKQIEIVISNLLVIQQQLPVKIGCMNISLLLSSIESGHPELIYEVYDEGMEIGNLLYAQIFQADWFLTVWEETKQQIQNKIKELNWDKYLGEEEVKALYYEDINMTVISLAHAIKYEFTDFMSYKGAEQLDVAEGFYLSIGEYRGWRKILYRYAKTVDILQQGLEKEFSYMRFYECQYCDRRLANFNLSNTRFEKCIFLKMTFHEVDFRDADFKECVFRECIFERCLLNGTVFEKCDMQRIEWKENQLRSGAVTDEEGGMDIYRPTFFVKSILYKHNFYRNIVAGCLKLACDENEVTEIENEIL